MLTHIHMQVQVWPSCSVECKIHDYNVAIANIAIISNSDKALKYTINCYINILS